MNKLETFNHDISRHQEALADAEASGKNVVWLSNALYELKRARIAYIEELASRDEPMKIFKYQTFGFYTGVETWAFCPACNYSISGRPNFCPNCGKRLKEEK